ncbi:MAG: hypothetical protein HY238_10410 [Acidobacteria bacterium]|nr:hypothetical protein [Acidobacteriota bacterium]
MVNFRLTEDEYEYLKDLCQTEGARSLSDFARAAVCRSIVASRPADEALDVRVQILDGKVGQLDRTVRQLAERMGGAPFSGSPKKKDTPGPC